MKPGLRTLLLRLTNNSDQSDNQPTSTFVISSQPSPPPYYPPPCVQPSLSSDPDFYGRDRFTTDQLVRHRLDRSQRSILRKQVPSDPAYSAISRYAGDWEAGAPPFDWEFDGASACDKWRHRVQNPIEKETIEDMDRESKVENEIVKGLEPDYNTAVNKEEFWGKMSVQFGWREGVGPILPPADIERTGNSGAICDEEEALPLKGRPITAWPSASSMFIPQASEVSSLGPSGSGSERRTLSHHSIRENQRTSHGPDGLQSKHRRVIKKDRQTELRDRYHENDVDQIREVKRPMHPSPFEDNSYPMRNVSGSSLYSVPHNIAVDGRRPFSELFMTADAEVPGPSLMAPFSWPEMPTSPSENRRLVPPLPLSRRSFLSMSKDMPVQMVRRKPLPRAETAPQLAENGRVEAAGEWLKVLKKFPTTPPLIPKDSLTLQEELRESTARVVKAERMEAERMVSKKRKGVGGWLSRLR